MTIPADPLLPAPTAHRGEKILALRGDRRAPSTAIDRDSSLLRLTTTLVHASGEWMSSDWPVCPVSETAAPHRMGAALTYARRYALFTLVGIAGEDDLDAPDLAVMAGPPAAHNGPTGRGNGHWGLANPSPAQTDRQPPPGRRTRAEQPKLANLSAEASAGVRDELISELEQVGEPDAVAAWAQRALPLKNQLSPADAQAVEAAFETRLTQLDEVERCMRRMVIPSEKSALSSPLRRSRSSANPCGSATATI
jgi:hypothetical protein